jgi:dihydrofolate synthase/folylpolyglutamate synthase
LAILAPSSLDEWLAYQAAVHPHAIDLGLERLNEVLARLQWRRPTAPVLSIAGTNGKGSVAAFSAAILTAAGLRVGVFTSPHLRDYRERIRIHDRYVSTDELLWAFERIEAARGQLGLTFFEYNTLAALLIFDAAKLDVWVLEIGMGGRLDAVNAVDADVAVVVSIGFDHQEFLGTSLDAIAREKAGIFRKDRPAVLGSRSMPGVLESTADSIGARLKRPGIEYDYTRDGATWHYRGTRWDLPNLPAPALLGDTQYGNAATAIAAVEEIGSQIAVSAAAVALGLQTVRLVGRFQVIAAGAADAPTWILDVAHNEEAARVLARNLHALAGGGRTLAVCGILADKDAVAIVSELRDCVDEWRFATTDGARGCSGAALADRVAMRLAPAPPALSFDSIAAACEAAYAAAGRGDRIVVFGSFHTVGPALDWLEAKDLLPPATAMA